MIRNKRGKKWLSVALAVMMVLSVLAPVSATEREQTEQTPEQLSAALQAERERMEQEMRESELLMREEMAALENQVAAEREYVSEEVLSFEEMRRLAGIEPVAEKETAEQEEIVEEPQTEIAEPKEEPTVMPTEDDPAKPTGEESAPAPAGDPAPVAEEEPAPVAAEEADGQDGEPNAELLEESSEADPAELLWDTTADESDYPILEQLAAQKWRNTQLLLADASLTDIIADELDNTSADESETVQIVKEAGARVMDETNGYIEIASAADLNAIREIENWQQQKYQLIADIDLFELPTSWQSLSGVFNRELDGAGYSIKNLYVEEGGGLFAEIGEQGNVHNLTLQNVTIVAENLNAVGAIAGSNAGTIENCFVEKSIIKGKDQVGGLVGNNSGRIIFSASHGEISGQTAVGGLVGYNNGQVQKSVATGVVLANNANAGDIAQAGGFVGHLAGGEIADSYAMVNPIMAASRSGGFVGQADSGAVINTSYAISRISGVANAAKRHGFVGFDNGAKYQQCYYDTTGPGTVYLQGNGHGVSAEFVTSGNSSRCFINPVGVTGIGLYMADTYLSPVSEASYEGFDFIGTWSLADDLSTFPVLSGMSAYATGPENPILIHNSSQLQAIPDACAWNYKLEADLDLSTAGPVWNPIYRFIGALNGNGKTLTNLHANVIEGSTAHGGLFGEMDYCKITDLRVSDVRLGDPNPNLETLGNLAVFGRVTQQGVFENLYAENLEIYTTGGSGGMFAGLVNSRVDNCHIKDVYIKLNQLDKDGNPINSLRGGLGGFSGSIRESVINDCTVANITIDASIKNLNGKLASSRELGGFVGSLGSATRIQNCHVYGGEVAGSQYLGGFLGHSYEIHSVLIEDCTSDVNVAGGDRAGGFIGNLHPVFYAQHDGTDAYVVKIKNCGATGDVSSGATNVGGFVGWSHHYAQYLDCYATGNVSGGGYYTASLGLSLVGGFVGSSMGVHYSNCFASGDVSGRKGVGGFVGMHWDIGSSAYWPKQNMDYPENPGYPNTISVPNPGFSSCFASGAVTSTDMYGNSATGGFVGYNEGTGLITDCYAVGEVYGYKNVGGFVGTLDSGATIDCYASGKVSAVVNGGAGGFAGLAVRNILYPLHFINCVYDRDLTGQGANQGIAEVHPRLYDTRDDNHYPQTNPPLGEVRGLSSSEMQKQDLFTQADDRYTFGRKWGSGSITMGAENASYKWEFDKFWALNPNAISPYLAQNKYPQLLQLETTGTTVDFGGSATISLKNYVGKQEGDIITWTTNSDQATLANTAGDSVTINAGAVDEVVTINVLVNGIKMDSVKVIVGTGGEEEGMKVIFVSPAPNYNGMGEAFDVSLRPQLQVMFTEPLDTTVFKQISNPVSVVSYNGGLTYGFSNNDRMLTTTLDKDLFYGETYTLQVNNTIKAATGLGLVGNKAIQFTVRSFAPPEVRLSQNGQAVTTLEAGNSYDINAKYTNQIINGEDYPVPETAKVFVVVRNGLGARETYGGDILYLQEWDLSVLTDAQATISVPLTIPTGLEGNVYVDIYTWSVDKDYAKAEPVHVTYTIQ